MKPVLLIIFLLTISSCGRNNRSSSNNNDNRICDNTNTLTTAKIVSMYVWSPMEAKRILNEARLTGRLFDYQLTRWYLHSGVYLFQSVVINDNYSELRY